jgi:hypothetical protein
LQGCSYQNIKEEILLVRQHKKYAKETDYGIKQRKIKEIPFAKFLY